MAPLDCIDASLTPRQPIGGNKYWIDMEESGSPHLINMPFDEITYSHVLKFCDGQFEEGIDLDYKSDFPSDLERILCALANTQGGIVFIGIAESDKSRLPICPPTGIDSDPDVTRQRILNIAFDAIYPPLEPEIKMVEVPETQNCIILIRVAPGD